MVLHPPDQELYNAASTNPGCSVGKHMMNIKVMEVNVMENHSRINIGMTYLYLLLIRGCGGSVVSELGS